MEHRLIKKLKKEHKSLKEQESKWELSINENNSQFMKLLNDFSIVYKELEVLKNNSGVKLSSVSDTLFSICIRDTKECIYFINSGVKGLVKVKQYSLSHSNFLSDTWSHQHETFIRSKLYDQFYQRLSSTLVPFSRFDQKEIYDVFELFYDRRNVLLKFRFLRLKHLLRFGRYDQDNHDNYDNLRPGMVYRRYESISIFRIVLNFILSKRLTNQEKEGRRYRRRVKLKAKQWKKYLNK